MYRKTFLKGLLLISVLMLTACGNKSKDDDMNNVYEEDNDSYEEVYEDEDSYESDDYSENEDSYSTNEGVETEYKDIPITSQYLSVFDSLQNDYSLVLPFINQIAPEYVGIWNSISYPYIEMTKSNQYVDNGILIKVTSDGYISILDSFGGYKREYAYLLNLPLSNVGEIYTFSFEDDEFGIGTGEVSLSDGKLKVAITRSNDEDPFFYYKGNLSMSETFIKDEEHTVDTNDLIYTTLKDYSNALEIKDIDLFNSFLSGNRDQDASVMKRNILPPIKGYVSTLMLNKVPNDFIFIPSSETNYDPVDLTKVFHFDESNWSTTDIIESRFADNINYALYNLMADEDRFYYGFQDILNEEIPSDYNKSMLVISLSDYYILASSDYDFKDEFSGNFVVFEKVSTGYYKLRLIAKY